MVQNRISTMINFKFTCASKLNKWNTKEKIKWCYMCHLNWQIKIAKCHFEQQNKDKSFFKSNLDTCNREPSLIKRRQVGDKYL